jgi:predicted outer membrane repeat protein
MKISDSTFERNKASKSTTLETSGNGGAFFYSCENYLCRLDVSNSKFSGNYAENEGGAIKWTDLEPIFTNNQFSSNSVKVYGNNIASFP